MKGKVEAVFDDDLIVTVRGRGTARDEFEDVEGVYADAYVEAPYNEGPDEVGEFVQSWPYRMAQPSFRIVVARLKDNPIGFTFGHQLLTTTRWWDGMLDAVDRDIVTERQNRTFAVIELAVSRAHRQRGVGRTLHAHLLAGLPQERVTLLVRPEAPAALGAYASWGYQAVGRLRPFPDAPVYHAMIKDLREVERPDGARPRRS